MSDAEAIALPIGGTTSTSAPEVAMRKRQAAWPKRLLIGGVGIYLALILLAPALSLLVETHRVGWSTALVAVTSPLALAALLNSFWLVLIAVVVNAVVGVAGALVLVRDRFFGRALLSACFDLPLAVSPVAIGLAFLLMVGREGFLGPWLDTWGLQILFSFPGLLIGTLFVTLPYTTREVGYVLEELGTSEEEAAATLGASSWQTFLRVTLPNVRVALGYGLLMTAARAIGEFGAVLVLGGSIAGKTQTATTFIHDAIEERARAGAYGMALLLGLISVTLLLFLERIKNRPSLATSQVK